MRVLVACEFSGIVRDAFIAEGADAVSCDLLPSERPGPHLRQNVLDLLAEGWDLMVAFPPCTYLAGSGARWWAQRRSEQEQAIEFALALWNAPIPRIAIENPVGILSRAIRVPDQMVQPWWFGHGETKRTCIWLKGLPLLRRSNEVAGREARIVNMNEGREERWRSRSRSYEGMAAAMAKQWAHGSPTSRFADA